jgi:hypothetical protein
MANDTPSVAKQITDAIGRMGDVWGMATEAETSDGVITAEQHLEMLQAALTVFNMHILLLANHIDTLNQRVAELEARN